MQLTGRNPRRRISDICNILLTEKTGWNPTGIILSTLGLSYCRENGLNKKWRIDRCTEKQQTFQKEVKTSDGAAKARPTPPPGTSARRALQRDSEELWAERSLEVDPVAPEWPLVQGLIKGNVRHALGVVRGRLQQAELGIWRTSLAEAGTHTSLACGRRHQEWSLLWNASEVCGSTRKEKERCWNETSYIWL